MRYGLIGCGRISINHLNAAFSSNLDVVACCDVVEEHIDCLFKKCLFDTSRIKKYDSYKTMIEENRLDLVAIATESGLHAEIALFCMNKGINVIIEKPMAMSMEDADEIIACSKKNHVKVCVCHQNRFNQAVVVTKKAIDEGRFGRLSHAAICVRWNRGRDYYNQAPWRGTWKNDGGTLMNQCIHGVDLLLYLVGGAVVSVYGQTRQQFHHYLEAEDVGMGLLSFDNGVIGTIEGTVNIFPSNLEETLFLCGENGTVQIGGKSTNTIDVWQFKDIRPEDSGVRELIETTPNVYGNGHKLLYLDMIDAIQKGRNPLIGPEEGRKALEIILSIYKSQRDKECVWLPLSSFASIDMKGTF